MPIAVLLDARERTLPLRAEVTLPGAAGWPEAYELVVLELEIDRRGRSYRG